MPIDPRPFSLREVVELASGAWDKEVQNRAFWRATLGIEVKADELEAMHPIRRAMRPPPPPKTEAMKKVESKAGWSMVMQYFGGTYQPTEPTEQAPPGE